MAKGLKLEDLNVYKVSMEIGEIVWRIVSGWAYFDKKTLGAQMVDAADSIGLNIAEGYGRFHFKENKNFCYYSRGSAKETWCALQKASARNLIKPEDIDLLRDKFTSYFRLMFAYIRSLGINETKSTSSHD